MKTLFLAITGQLETVADLAWIDDDFGQLETPSGARPAVAFPCALVNISYPSIEDAGNPGDMAQVIRAQVQVRIGFDPVTETSSIVPEAFRLAAVNRFDIAQKVFEALQGFDANGQMGPMTRISQTPEQRRDNFKVIRMVFKTDFME